MTDWFDYEERERERAETEAVKEELRSIKERVEWLLKNYPETRNDDRYLIILYMRFFTPMRKYLSFVPYRVIKELPSFESIRRARQLIQEKGKYLPTDPNVMRRRGRLMEAYRRGIVELREEE